jgi:hypothetical protein
VGFVGAAATGAGGLAVPVVGAVEVDAGLRAARVALLLVWASALTATVVLAVLGTFRLNVASVVPMVGSSFSQ